MPSRLKRDAVLVAVFAALFYWAFMFAKHDPVLGPIIPFGEDPYDAVGSFAVIAAMLVAVLALVRAFRPYGGGGPSAAQQAYLVRTLAAVGLMVLITAVADAVALARDPSHWVAARGEIVLLVGGMLAGAVVIVRYVTRSTAPAPRAAWTRAGIAGAAAVLVLALYPERLIRPTSTHLLSVVVGALLLFAPNRPLLGAFVPLDAAQRGSEHAGRRRPWLRWVVVVGIGLMVGVFAFLGEMSEGGAPSPAQTALVAAVFLGLATAGVLIAYALLGEPLGLGGR